MPQLGESVTEGTVDRWLKKEGDFVKRDEPLVEVVTDKVNAEIPSPFEGTLVKISVTEGSTVNVGAEIAQIETEAAAAASAPAEAPPQPAAAPTPATPSPSPDGGRTAPEAAEEKKSRFSPAVRRLAEEHGINPATIKGSGEGGRVTRDDVLAFVQAGSQPAAPAEAPAAPAPAPSKPPTQPSPREGEEELVRISAVRRSIAEHMVRSKATSPHAWTLIEVDVSELVKYREAEKEGFRARHGFPLTYLPFVAQILCEALHEFPYLNSSWTDDGILLKKYIHLGIAVAYPEGLIVPVVHNADHLGFTELARTMNDLATRARNKQLKPEDVQGGTFTLNNTGANGSFASGPIINQPQAAILTTETIERRPRVINEAIAIRSIMNMCMSFDHRIIDGLTAGQFINWIKARLEGWTPASLRL